MIATVRLNRPRGEFAPQGVAVVGAGAGQADAGHPLPIDIGLMGELDIVRIDPAEPVEHQPIHIVFNLRNTSGIRPLEGGISFVNRGNGQSGGRVNVVVPPGASFEGILDGFAPAAAKDAELDFAFWEPPTPDGREVLSPALQWTGTVNVAAIYELRIDSIAIDNPRSTRNDTVRAEATAIYEGQPLPNPAPASPFDQPGTQVQDFGNHGGGTVLPARFRFGPFRGVPGVAGPVKFNFIVDNRGFRGSAEEVGGKVLNTLSEAGQALATFEIPQGAAAFDKANDVHQRINNALFSSCDGIVAADQIVMNSDVLDAVTNGDGLHTENRHYGGSSSPVVCGATSNYHVMFTVTRTSFSRP